MSLTCPAVLVSAPASGQGKTLITAALARAWRNKGLRVRAFKCGPDFLDPMILEVATGRPVYNLDFTMCGESDGQAQLYRAAQNADVIIVEGVMGLYDGTPSAADIAVHFGLPAMLTIDASGMAQTFGALASGLLAFQPALIPAGVLANKVGSAGHAKLLQDCLPPHLSWFGALQKNEVFSLPERHLGLFRASEMTDLETKIEAAAHALAESSHLNLPPLVNFNPPTTATTPALLAGKTIAVAKDAAFCFIYQANLDCLADMGATLKFFSPLHENSLPEADAYWLPGGYPELHLVEISENIGMKNSLIAAFNANKPILAECGGMMALSESIDGSPTFGLLAGTSQIHQKLQGLGSLKAELAQGEIGAHTFHYGSFETTLTPIATVKTRFGKAENIYQHGNITASFLHFYFASNPQIAASLFLP
ncbi:MAG: cobyrinate a,c-diamide synthase [Methylotenera sp.]|nr:cobyrinate a,c-diamide synthase [Methylotenera sp.]